MPRHPLWNSNASLDLLGKILDISLDIDRNRSDADFAKADGEFFYVFDENIFEVFIRPSSRAFVVNSFHSQVLYPERTRQESLLESQTALIASEFLLSNRLPGSRRNLLYMTKGHRDELLRRTRILAAELDEKLRDNEDTAIKELSEKVQMLAQPAASASSAVRIHAKDDKQLYDDIQALLESGADPAALLRFQLARIGSRLLATSAYIEPLEQLERLFSAPLFPRIRTLHLDFVPGRQDLKDINSDARSWFTRLVEERANDQKKRANVRSPEIERSDASLRTDAETIAFVRWAATRGVYSNQRVVLITGDRILFNAYRRWYASLKHAHSAYYEPFILRRASQYLPILNIADSDNDISKGIEEHARLTELFARLRSVVEMALLPLNFLQYRTASGELKEMEGARRHHRLALALHYLGALEDDIILATLKENIDAEWYIQTEEQILEILSSLRTVERLSLGAFLSYVTLRMNDEHRELARSIEQSGQAKAGVVLQKHLAQILERVRVSNQRAWPLLAEEFVHELTPPASNARRVPLTIWYRLSGKRRISELIEFWLTAPGQVKWKEILRETKAREGPFVIAATLALFSDQWSEAERFASIGVGEYIAAHPDSYQQDADYFEILYLCALTKRFRLGNIETHIDEVALNDLGQIGTRSLRFMSDTYESASSILNMCLERPRNTLDSDDDSCTLWRMRVLSERASLKIFATISFIPDLNSTHYDARRLSAFNSLDSARLDVAECFRLEPNLSEKTKDCKPVKMLRRQYLLMLVASEVLRSILLPPDQYVFREDLLKYKETVIDTLQTKKPTPSAFVRAQVLAFLILAQGDTAAAKDRENLKHVLDRDRFQNLAIDRWLLNAINLRFIQRTASSRD